MVDRMECVGNESAGNESAGNENVGNENVGNAGSDLGGGPTQREIVLRLLQATSKPVSVSTYGLTAVDYYRIVSQAIFRCKRCGRCCTTGNPIKLKHSDVVRIAKHLKIPVNKAMRKLAVPYTENKSAMRPPGPGQDVEEIYAFKKILPCKFHDELVKGCKIYEVRPWSCRIFPFLGIYGSEDRVKVHESCPGSVETAERLTALINEVRSDPAFNPPDDEAVDEARRWLVDLLETLY